MDDVKEMPTYWGQKPNQGLLVPTGVHEKEGYAKLECGDTSVVLTYTDLHLIHGWLCAGSSGYSLAHARGEILKAFAAVACEASMGKQGTALGSKIND